MFVRINRDIDGFDRLGAFNGDSNCLGRIDCGVEGVVGDRGDGSFVGASTSIVGLFAVRKKKIGSGGLANIVCGRLWGV